MAGNTFILICLTIVAALPIVIVLFLTLNFLPFLIISIACGILLSFIFFRSDKIIVLIFKAKKITDTVAFPWLKEISYLCYKYQISLPEIYLTEDDSSDLIVLECFNLKKKIIIGKNLNTILNPTVFSDYMSMICKDALCKRHYFINLYYLIKYLLSYPIVNSFRKIGDKGNINETFEKILLALYKAFFELLDVCFFLKKTKKIKTIKIKSSYINKDDKNYLRELSLIKSIE